MTLNGVKAVNCVIVPNSAALGLGANYLSAFVLHEKNAKEIHVTLLYLLCVTVIVEDEPILYVTKCSLKNLVLIFPEVSENAFVMERCPPIKSDNLINTARYLANGTR